MARVHARTPFTLLQYPLYCNHESSYFKITTKIIEIRSMTKKEGREKKGKTLRSTKAHLNRL
jgi:hypothetical protein